MLWNIRLGYGREVVFIPVVKYSQVLSNRENSKKKIKNAKKKTILPNGRSNQLQRKKNKKNNVKYVKCIV
jgi:hypothetical protein